MSPMSSACFQLGPSTDPGMAHCPLATARAPGKGNGRKRLSRAQPSLWELTGGPIQPAFIHSLIHSFDKIIQLSLIHRPFVHSATSMHHILMPRGKSFRVAAKFFIQQSHSFIRLFSSPPSSSLSKSKHSRGHWPLGGQKRRPQSSL